MLLCSRPAALCTKPKDVSFSSRPIAWCDLAKSRFKAETAQLPATFRNFTAHQSSHDTSLLAMLHARRQHPCPPKPASLDRGPLCILQHSCAMSPDAPRYAPPSQLCTDTHCRASAHAIISAGTRVCAFEQVVCTLQIFQCGLTAVSVVRRPQQVLGGPACQHGDERRNFISKAWLVVMFRRVIFPSNRIF